MMDQKSTARPIGGLSLDPSMSEQRKISTSVAGHRLGTIATVTLGTATTAGTKTISDCGPDALDLGR
jgi:hypothetical protein